MGLTAGVVAERPMLRPGLRAARTAGSYALEHAQMMRVFDGDAAEYLFPVLLPLLDGSRSVGELVALIGAEFEDAVRASLEALAGNNLLVDGALLQANAPSAVRDAAIGLASIGDERLARAHAAERIGATLVSVAGSSPVATQIAELLARSGVRVARSELADLLTEATPNLIVVAPDGDGVPDVSRWNEELLSRRQPWLIVLPFDGRSTIVGPFFLPTESACYRCFQTRRGAALGFGAMYWALEGAARVCVPGVALDAIVAGIAAQSIMRWIGAGDMTLAGAFYVVEQLPVLRVTLHRLLRVPRCRVCSRTADTARPSPRRNED